MGQKGFVFLPIILIIAILGVAGYFAYQHGQLQTSNENATSPSTPIISNISSSIATTEPVENWKTYTSSKNNYSIKYPSILQAEFGDNKTDPYATEFSLLLKEPATSNSLQLIVYKKGNFDKSLSDLVLDNYNQNKDHFQTTKISDLKHSKFSGISDYEYTFTGRALHTIDWAGAADDESTWKVIFLEKNNKIYSLYIRGDSVFDQVLSTFKFIK